MKILYLCVFLLSLASCNALDCHGCTAGLYQGESTSTAIHNCYNTATAPSPTSCTAPSGETAYCKTSFTIKDGIPTAVTRSCETATTVPTAELCNAAIDPTAQDVDTTTCTYVCTTTNCNTQSTTSLIKCSSDCNSGVGGYCDYIQGTCVCTGGYSGSDCSTAPTTTATSRTCVQCNSDIDATCATSTPTATACEGSNTYCYSARSYLLDESNVIRKTTVTRGCTSTFVAVDQCSFSDNADFATFSENEYFDYTCYSTCTTDGCNTDSPDGIVNGNEKQNLYCVQCSFDVNTGVGDSCSMATSRTVCSDSTATHCSSTVKYWISDRVDTRYTDESPEYKLVSVERGCATAAVTTQCTNTTVASLSFQEVTCQETCDVDGCNTGWPARPDCFQCSSDTDDLKDGYDLCRTNPLLSSACPMPYHQYCGIKEQRRDDKSTDLYPFHIERNCYYKSIGNGCAISKVGGVDFRKCNETCTEDNCNAGSGGAQIVASVIMSLIPAILLSLQ